MCVFAKFVIKSDSKYIIAVKNILSNVVIDDGPSVSILEAYAATLACERCL